MFYLKAEEITLTIGQAFDLAYRKFLESGGKDVETRKQIAGLQKRVCSIVCLSLTNVLCRFFFLKKEILLLLFNIREKNLSTGNFIGHLLMECI